MKNRNGRALLASMLFSLVVGTRPEVMAAENKAVGLADNLPSQITLAEKATADIKNTVPVSVKKQQVRQITGLVTAISGNHLNVKKGNKAFAFKVEEGMVIRSGSVGKSLSDLKVGDKIMVKHIENGGVLIARSIHLKIDTGK